MAKQPWGRNEAKEACIAFEFHETLGTKTWVLCPRDILLQVQPSLKKGSIEAFLPLFESDCHKTHMCRNKNWTSKICLLYTITDPVRHQVFSCPGATAIGPCLVAFACEGHNEGRQWRHRRNLHQCGRHLRELKRCCFHSKSGFGKIQWTKARSLEDVEVQEFKTLYKEKQRQKTSLLPPTVSIVLICLYSDLLRVMPWLLPT